MENLNRFRFRLWDKNEKKMKFGHNYLIDFMGDIYWQYGDGELELLDKDEVILMQFTGIPDKNKKEIYEGDIITVDYDGDKSTHKVEWGENNYPAWALNPTLGIEVNDFSEIICFGSYEMEIIGNVWETPELLKEKT